MTHLTCHVLSDVAPPPHPPPPPAARSDGVEEVGKLLKALQRLQVRVPDDAARRNRWSAAVDMRKNLVKLATILRQEAEVRSLSVGKRSGQGR